MYATAHRSQMTHRALITRLIGCQGYGLYAQDLEVLLRANNMPVQTALALHAHSRQPLAFPREYGYDCAPKERQRNV